MLKQCKVQRSLSTLLFQHRVRTQRPVQLEQLSKVYNSIHHTRNHKFFNTENRYRSRSRYSVVNSAQTLRISLVCLSVSEQDYSNKSSGLIFTKFIQEARNTPGVALP